jgi:hypothetical protein
VSRRWASFGAVAAVVHVGIFVALGRLRPPAAPTGAPGPDDTVVAAIDLVPEVAAGHAPLEETAVVATAHGAVLPRERVSREASSAPPGGVGEAPAVAPTASARDDGWTFTPTKPVDVTDPAFVARAVRGVGVAPDAPEGASRSAGGLGEALEAHDVEMGLGSGGPVLSALEAAARDTDAPVEGWALFDVAVDTSGRVSVVLDDVSSGQPAWARVGAAAGHVVDPKRVRIPPGARGWHVVVRVEAKIQYPDGTKPKDLGGHVETSAGELSGKNPYPERLPGARLVARGKVCSVALDLSLDVLRGLPLLSGGCSPENAGALPLRIVSGRIMSEGRL